MAASLGVTCKTFSEDIFRIRYHETASEIKQRGLSMCCSEKTSALIGEGVIINL
jgi:hypothetical protein